MRSLASPRLATRRLVLRPPAARDVPALLAYLELERTEMRRWSPRRPAVYFTRGFQRRSVDATERRRRKGELLALLVFLKGRERDVVGRVTLSNVVRGAFHAASVGYSLAEPHRGRGLMHEALRAVLDYAFGTMGLHRVTAAWMPANRPSGRVLRRLGFRRDGLARKYLLIDGKWEDHVLTSLVNTRWRPPADQGAQGVKSNTKTRRARSTRRKKET